MGMPATPSTQLTADTYSAVYDPGVVTGGDGANLLSKLYWNDDAPDNKVLCIKVSCGEDVSCVQVGSGTLYSPPGSTGWGGLDMSGQGRSVEAHWTGCQARCAAVLGCEYF